MNMIKRLIHRLLSLTGKRFVTEFKDSESINAGELVALLKTFPTDRPVMLKQTVGCVPMRHSDVSYDSQGENESVYIGG